ncbi:hypothetical protein BC830DRAFT_1089895 [Chytriomyces sp. MP71]|nr:hypothetical protein BC830DRAFT_1089895 [Chytriomyces sp. MP71]
MGISNFTSNPLLVKDSVGKTRPTVFDLPGHEHVYGKKVDRDPEECAAQVLQHWNVKATSKHAVPALDYITMNRNTAKQGINSPRAIREYRKQHPVRMKIGDHNLYGGELSRGDGDNLTSAEARKMKLLGTLPHDNDPNFVYGMPTRPSTPVAYLMTDKFQREWIETTERRNNEKAHQDKERAIKKQTKTVTPCKIAIPKKLLLVDKDPKSLFKMSKFLKQGPKITSWRGEDAVKHAFVTPARGEGGNGGRSRAAAREGVDAGVEEAARKLDGLKLSKDKSGAHANVEVVAEHHDGAAASMQSNGPVAVETVNGKPRVRFVDPANAKGSRTVKVMASMDPSPVAYKKLLAAPGAAPEHWNGNAVSV